MNDPTRPANNALSTPIQFVFFFLICLGLGYATLKRYDPRETGNNPDSAYYYQIVTGQATEREFWRYRVLVPLVARPFYKMAEGRIGTWDPVLFGLLAANSLFVAGTALLLVRIGMRITGNHATAIIASLVYLLNFSVTNFYLAGFVDSGEAFFMALVVLMLLSGRWLMLPLCGVLGALAKETFVPLSSVFAAIWWIEEKLQRRSRIADFGGVLAMLVAGFATMTTVQSAIAGHTIMPWQLTVTNPSVENLPINVVRCVGSHEFLYVFGWLLPFGLVKLRGLPRAWVFSAAATSLVALLLGASVNARGNVTRPLFAIAGPMLSLSVAVLIGGISLSGGDRSKPDLNERIQRSSPSGTGDQI
jgi:hypothetical protein